MIVSLILQPIFALIQIGYDMIMLASGDVIAICIFDMAMSTLSILPILSCRTYIIGFIFISNFAPHEHRHKKGHL